MRIAILVAGSPEPALEKRFGSFAQMFRRFLAEPGEAWPAFDVQIGCFPDRSDVYDGFLITGSSADAHGDERWIRTLETYVLSQIEAEKKCLGICFGHQLLANALGGKTGRNPLGWELGRVGLNWSFQQRQPSWLPAEIEKTSWLYQVHQDHVQQPPKHAVCFATSDKTPVQGFYINDLVLGIQGHPEFSADFVEALSESLYARGLISSHLFKQAVDSLKARVDRSCFRRMIRDFLKRDAGNTFRRPDNR